LGAFALTMAEMQRTVSVNNKKKLRDLLEAKPVAEAFIPSAANAGASRPVPSTPSATKLANASRGATTLTVQPSSAVLANGQQVIMLANTDMVSVTSASPTPRILAPRPAATDVSSATLSVAPHSLFVDASSLPQPKDAKRKATHNEVERRRRTNINAGIDRLGQLLNEHAATGDGASTSGGSGGKIPLRSKGDVLSRTYNYIEELRHENACLRAGQGVGQNEHLQRQIEELRKENALLRQTLSRNGLVLAGQAGQVEDDDDDDHDDFMADVFKNEATQ